MNKKVFFFSCSQVGLLFLIVSGKGYGKSVPIRFMQPASGEAGDRRAPGLPLLTIHSAGKRIGFYLFKGTLYFLKEGVLSSISSSNGTSFLTSFSSNGTTLLLFLLPKAPLYTKNVFRKKDGSFELNFFFRWHSLL